MWPLEVWTLSRNFLSNHFIGMLKEKLLSLSSSISKPSLEDIVRFKIVCFCFLVLQSCRLCGSFGFPAGSVNPWPDTQTSWHVADPAQCTLCEYPVGSTAGVELFVFKPAFCHFFHSFLNDHHLCACSPEGLVLSPYQGESRDGNFLSLSVFFVCSKPQVTSDMDSLCNDFVYTVQIPGLSSGCGDKSYDHLVVYSYTFFVKCLLFIYLCWFVLISNVL